MPARKLLSCRSATQDLSAIIAPRANPICPLAQSPRLVEASSATNPALTRFPLPGSDTNERLAPAATSWRRQSLSLGIGQSLRSPTTIGAWSEISARLVAAHQSERQQVDERRQLAPISASSDVTPRRRIGASQHWAACSGELLTPKAPQVIVVRESFLKGWRAMR
jgi:hypothetical protein